MYEFLLASILVATIQGDKRLNPSFEIATPAGMQVFREELAVALLKTPDANPGTRMKFRAEAEKLAQELFRKGQKIYHLPKKKLTIYWDQLDPTQLASSSGKPREFSIHLNEIMFFTAHEDHMKLMIPHEVAHILHYLQFGFGNEDHDESFLWIVRELAPDYKYKEVDMAPARRLSDRLLETNR